MVVVVYFVYSSHHFTTPSKHICIETIQTYKLGEIVEFFVYGRPSE